MFLHFRQPQWHPQHIQLGSPHPMHDCGLHFFKGLSPAGHFSWLVLLVVSLSVDRYTANPDMIDRPLAASGQNR